MTRLNDAALAALPADIAKPAYDRSAHGVGIVHLGVGAFHKAHQAIYTEDALAAQGGDWRIAGVSLRRADAEEALAPQDGLYTLIERRPEGPSARVVGILAEVVTAPNDRERTRALLTAPATRIVSITVTEKGYGIDPAKGGLDAARADIAADLASPQAPRTVVGWIVHALALRRAAGVAPFTPLCCDNLPENGHVLARLVRDFAERIDPDLAAWIAAEVPFPSTMVDRITPATTPETHETARRLTGFDDEAATETEPFSQWVVEDRFCAGRPAWEEAGVVLAADVRPYEAMKLRLLNGAHSLIAYAGAVAGLAYVRDVMAEETLAALVAAHQRDVARTLDPVPGIDLDAYQRDLRERFANPAMAHRTVQIAMDGSQKLPPRIVAPAMEAIEAGLPWRSCAFVVAAWMRFLSGRDQAGAELPLSDPLADMLRAAYASSGDDPDARVKALLSVEAIFPRTLASHYGFARAVTTDYRRILAGGVIPAARAALAEIG
ncbi:mannitol dehydrogenase family protein [Salinarimonas ramus]|uniref:Mannitol dehydrogenase n=1 Tax=Salinarimonas ramus TaxID=690164 RepID=A0A917Q4A3_9HYPH|nr:mannitol dehydrogenase family protein [Salinarimonas ramus]GGK21875.1 mannitol dehydrogenase [Salinarimonas ramus]